MIKIELEEVKSTNAYLKDLNFDDSVIAFCKNQTNGYGQYNRLWYSSINESLVFSYKYNKNNIPKVDEYFIKKIVNRFANLINDYFKIESVPTGVNDIYLNNKKLCGILIETKYCNNLIDIIIGIGLNINNNEFPVEIKESATSIFLETGNKYSIDDLKNYIFINFETKIIKE